MAIELINIGQVANDGTGDDLREAFYKINLNFEELDLRDDEKTSAVNIGALGEGLFAKREGYELQFKKLVAGADVSITSTDDTVIIDSSSGVKRILVVSDNGSLILQDIASINILGGEGIETSLVGNDLTITNTKSEIVTDTTPQLGGDLDAQTFDLNNVGDIDANLVNGSFIGNLTGNVTGLVYGLDVRNFAQYAEDNYYDFGEIGQSVNNLLELVLIDYAIDMGSFTNPNVIDVNVSEPF